jgi:putative FmdB family regulatory protein
MPIYTYECENCGERFEAKQSFSDAPLVVCPTCEGKLYRVIQPVGIVFKGSGFYVTDSRGKQTLATSGVRKDEKDEAKSSDGGSAETATASATSDKSSSKSTDTKPASSATSSDSE